MEQHEQQVPITSTASLLTRAFLFIEYGEWKKANEYLERILDLEPQNGHAYLGKLMVDLKVKKREELQNSNKLFDDNLNYKKAVRFGDHALRTELMGYSSSVKAQEMGKKPKPIGKVCAIVLMAVLSLCVCAAVVMLIKSLSVSTDEKNNTNRKRITEQTKTSSEVEQTQKYEAAIALMEEGKYTEAITAFKALSGYKESADKVAECEAKQLEAENAQKYENAVALMEEGKFTEAITAFEALGDYQDSADKAEECSLEVQYNEAIALLETDDIIAAYEALVALDGYKDSAEKADSIYNSYQLKTVKVGDYITFGHYEQDKDAFNGKEPIEWLVLDIRDGKALVLSRYGLEAEGVHSEYEDITWANCSIRTWLREEFMSAAFSEEEKAMISTVTVQAHKNPDYSTGQGKDTQDQIFLLSIEEVNKYFGEDDIKACRPTNYAVADGASGDGSCYWWLRTMGSSQHFVAAVDLYGDIHEKGYYLKASGIAVRPAMWIDLGE